MRNNKTDLKLKGLLLVLVVFFLPFCKTSAFAEGYGDYFLYDVEKLPSQILVDTVGVVWITAAMEETTGNSPQLAPVITTFQAYEHKGGQFLPTGEVRVDDTLPVGRGGYGGWVNYWVAARMGDFVQIVIEPYKENKVWLKLSKDCSLINFSELADSIQPMESEIDIFILGPEVNLYAEPKEGKPFKILHKADSLKKVYYPVAFTDNYIQIGLRYMDQDRKMVIPGKRRGDMIDGEPIGWIRMRDLQGRIAFHLFTYTWY